MEVSANLNKFSKAHVIRNFLKNNDIKNEKNDEIINTIDESIQNYYRK